MNEVEAVKDRATIERIEYRLAEIGQVYADIWRVGLNLALRISDLVALKYEDVAGDELSVIEGKTGKRRRVPINSTARAVIERRRKEYPDHVYLFQSDSNRSKALVKPVSREMVARVFKQVGEGKSIGVRLGTHSMRKTRGYMMHSAGKPIELICRVLNHSSPAVTMRYIGITQQDIGQTYTDFEL